ncbi:unnamed protein product [Gadus morhua 'NCC']
MLRPSPVPVLHLCGALPGCRSPFDIHQCAICVERYLAVVHPLTFIRFKPLRFRVVCSGVMWFTISFNLSSIWTADPRDLLIIALVFFTTLSCSICVERYLAVVHPLTFIRFKPLRFRVVCSALMWFAISCSIIVERYLAVVHPLTFIS